MDARLDIAIGALRGRRVVALTGAGVSTESGIPDYRSPEAAARPRKPLQGPDFVKDPTLRQRYWARAMVGWERFKRAEPGPSHAALAAMERAGAVRGLITQNVDRLHTRAGSREIVELHGALAESVCLACGALEDRDAVQARMRADNPSWIDGPSPMAPDGDADLPDELVRAFTAPTCALCAGPLKPNVVLFGHNVPRPTVDRAFAMVDDADALLVAGTSLAVFSGYRFLRRAVERRATVVIVNRGPVRGEEHATVKLEGATGELLSALARALT
ncbi:MAG: Sir2 family NAD-dependent protein deacetylase [Polyangiaceae bacterium]